MRLRLHLLTVFFALFAAPVVANDWVRAESTQFIVYSDGNRKGAAKAALELERLDALLRKLWRRDSTPNGSKLEVYLLKDSRSVNRMAGNEDNDIGIAGLYRGQTYGSFFMGNRRRSKFDEVLTGREVLFHEYAHHFFYQNFAIPAPAWFSEGFADYVSSAEVPESGGWAIGRPLQHRRTAIIYGGQVPIRDLLTGEDRNDHLISFYAWSWAMTRYLYSSEQNRGSKITRYLALLNDGVDNLEAAEKAFGNLDRFALDLREFVRTNSNFRRSATSLDFDDGVAVVELSKMESELLELKLLRLNLAKPQERLEALQNITSRPDASATAWYELAQTRHELIEKNAGASIAQIESALDRALELEPDHMRANVLRGLMHLKRSDDAESGEESELMSLEAAANFRRALTTAPNHPWPTFNLAQALRYADSEGEERGELLERAFALAPESGQIRFSYAAHLANNGEVDRAIRLLQIIANDPHGRGASAASFIEQLETYRADADTEDDNGSE
ncbi:hypothetical protein BPTFM16_01416 [Altererythrobacter insulae]|nr:hypothetical protein BPTFM16_01416 [Altererythrobacter insulae]